jgi:hypothetical protein
MSSTLAIDVCVAYFVKIDIKLCNLQTIITENATMEISFDTWDFSAVRLATQGVTYPQIWFRQSIHIYLSDGTVYKHGAATCACTRELLFSNEITHKCLIIIWYMCIYIYI